MTGGQVKCRTEGGRVRVSFESLDGRQTIHADLDDEQANRLENGIHQARRELLDEQTRRLSRPPEAPGDKPPLKGAP